MMIKMKRILSCVLVLLLIVTSVPATSISAINDGSEPTVTAEVVQTNFTPELEEAEDISVSDNEDNPIASVSTNYVTAQTGIVVNSNGQITRAEWLHNLAVIFEMTIESNAMPDNYFSDLEESHEYYEDILLAVEFGVVNIEAGEPIYPDEPVTRDFAASTLNFCLGYQLDAETEYTFADYAECADSDSAQVAVDRGWFTLVSGKFSPNLYITESEAERILNDAAAILEQTIVDDNYDSEFVFADDVIVVPDGTDVIEDGNGQISISDCPVIINKDDKFAVYFNGIPCVYTADSVTTDKTVTKITATVVDGDESFINVDAQGVAGADVMEIEPVEGVDVSFEDETSAVSTYAIRKIKTIKAKTELELFPGVTADVSVKIKSPQVEYSINSNYAYVTLEGDTEISYNIEANVAEMYLGDKAVELFTCSVLGVGNFTVSVEFKVSGSASGSVKGYLVAGLECTNGGKLRAIKSFQQKQYSTNIEATASVGLKVKLGITKMPVINAYVYAEAGVKANLKTTIYNNSESNKCVNFKAYLYAKYGAQASAKFGGWKTSLSVEYDIFNESNSPVKIVHHYENGMLVPSCTKGAESSNYFTNDSSRWSGSGWKSANGAYGLSADGTPVARYTYTLDDKNNATITKYNGNSWSLYIPEEIDGYTVVAIGSQAFSNEEMVSIVIPDTVTKIEWRAFDECTSLKEVKLSNTLTYLGTLAFGNTAIEKIEIPKSLNDCELSGPFYECEQLKKVTFESGITKIPESVFENCTGLESIVIPDTVTVIEASAFNNATALKNVTLSKSLTSIESNAFYSCSSIEIVVIPDTVTRIEYDAFSQCTSLKEVILSDSLTYLGWRAFGNTAIEEIEIPKSLDECGDLYGPFYECEQLKKVTFESGITQIPEGLFSNCPGLESIVIPDTVTVIESYAFYNATALKNVTLSSNLTSIGSSAFLCCSSLESIVIPDTVTRIENSAFSQCTLLKEVVIPDSVTSLGWNCFEGCTSLENIKLSNKIESIPYSILKNCTSLQAVEFPEAVKSIESYAFYGCTFLKEAVLPETVATIGSYAFQNCSSLTKVSIPRTTKTIDIQTFMGCEKLSELNISDYSITEIKSQTFKDCPGLVNVVLPKGLKTIGSEAFVNCTSLAEVYIPESVTSIDKTAFSYPDKMTIAGRTGSYAETFAKENSFKFVDKSVPAEGITLLNGVEEVVVDRGETFNADFECFPDNATDVITLMSDNSNVKIDGLDITGRYKGVSVITATATSGVTYEFTVRVRDVKSIDVVTLPKKLSYNIGEELDLSGMVVEVIRDDGSVEEITDYEVTGFDNSIEGECKVTVKWVALSGSSYTSTFTVDIIDTRPKINGIYIAKTPTKLNYAPKESLDLTGMVVIATYTDGSEQEIVDYKLSGYNALKKGSQTITVTYGEFMVTFDVYVGTSGENISPSAPDTTDPTEYTTGDNTKPSEPAVDKGILGDVNGDGKVNIKDATQIQKAAAKIIELTSDEKLRADVNADAKVNVKDATVIQKFVAKIETGFLIGDKIA